MGTDRTSKMLEGASDEELMQEFARGNEERFSALYERYCGRVYGYLKRKLKDSTMIEEAFQESFLKMVKARKTFDSANKFAPWFFTIVHHCLIDVVRKERRYGKSEAIVFTEIQEVEEAAPQKNLETIIGSLSERDRNILALRFNEDLSFEGIASKLEMTVTNVRQVASRAIRKLRKEHL